MGMKRIKKLVAITGKYTVDGVEKKRYQTAGALFKDEEGKLSVKMECIPLGEWNGWLGVYDLEDTRQPAGQGQAQVNVGAPAAPSSFDDDIPF